MNYKIQCPFCFESFWIDLFPEDGETQQTTIYDCEVCCHPIEIDARWNSERERFKVQAHKSSGF